VTARSWSGCSWRDGSRVTPQPAPSVVEQALVVGRCVAVTLRDRFEHMHWVARIGLLACCVGGCRRSEPIREESFSSEAASQPRRSVPQIAPLPAEPGGVEVRLVGPGECEVVNHDERPCCVQPEIYFEMFKDGGWKPEVTPLRFKGGSIAPGGSQKVAPWTGYNGCVQGGMSCSRNYSVPPGLYRFVARTCEVEAVPSEPFSMVALGTFDAAPRAYFYLDRLEVEVENDSEFPMSLRLCAGTIGPHRQASTDCAGQVMTPVLPHQRARQMLDLRLPRPGDTRFFLHVSDGNGQAFQSDMFIVRPDGRASLVNPLAHGQRLRAAFW
jgi:hypothetical protein